ncbi:tRNA (5-methylaminomethyl-2-thiouridylate)-methyltransferase [hydrothermal vent metagenome]|uniref:tRNA (5-methylaminomethyl-2-thiouridylate)-methyltransferase n=1 Tax=hydrothermal vent metagenome TaxID=652676 RepID=A0A1W1BH80_9ZZZZ
MAKKIKAISLISGGLDSMLSTKLLLDQGIHVEGINFFTGFCVEGHTHAIRKKHQDKEKRNNALWVAEQLGIKMHIVDVIEEYKDVLLNPKHGYGKNMNPCLDCKGFMVKKAKQWIEENGFDFIITGEVMGQRPMSQRRDTMPVVQKDSGAYDLLLRPLCAKHLPPTKPELEGWVDREKLLDFHGRTRKPQMALAKKYGFVDYASPAGGCCFLTDKNYSDKLVDLWQTRADKRDYTLDDLMMLKVGRHIRPNKRFKLIIAREESEVNFLEGYRKQYSNIYPISCHGPLALIDGEPNQEDLKLASQIIGRFSKDKNKDEITIGIRLKTGIQQQIVIKPLGVDEIPKDWYV